VNPVSRRLADTEKMRAMLGFAADIPLQRGLRDLVGWWRAQRQAAPALSGQPVAS
jgi:UDP-glucose 4-epimerase